MPLDILVPYWGDAALLETSVRSVLAQSDPEWLLTVVDDASPGGSLRTFFDDLGDTRVRYLRNPSNKGITDNYRTCVSLATQDRVVLLGCDDLLLPHYVETVRRAAEQFPDAAVIQPGVRVIDESGRPVRTLADTVKQRLLRPRAEGPRLLRGEPLAVSLLRGDWLYWPSLAFRRADLLATPFRDDLPLIQDLALVLDIVSAGGSLLLEPTVCFEYRRHAASASSATLTNGQRFQGERAYFALAEAQFRALGWRRAERAARLHLMSRLHALSLLPVAARHGGQASVAALARHVVASAP